MRRKTVTLINLIVLFTCLQLKASVMSQQLQTPPWLTKSYLETALKQYLKLDDLKIKNFNIAPGSKQGEGFLSLLLRVLIEYEANSKTSNIKIILKTDRDNSGSSDDETEILFFEKVGGKMLKIFEDLAETSKVIPDVIFIDKSRGVLMMEDLRVLNFTTSERLKGLDEKQVKISLEKLAKFHAASLKILSENPKAFESFNEGVINRNAHFINYYHEQGFRDAVEEVSTWEGLEDIKRKLENLKGSFLEKSLKCFDVVEKDLNVLNHGDLWITNLMFRYEREELKDAVLLDFQFSHVGSAALDLMRFFYSSLNDEIMIPSKMEEFVKFYYKELKEVLNKMNFEVLNFPTLETFKEEYKRKIFYGFNFLFTNFPAMMTDIPDFSFDAIFRGDEKSKDLRRRIHKNARYQKLTRRFLPYFNEIGIFD